MFGTILTKSITFFASREAAQKVCDRGGMTEDEGYRVIPAKGRDGKFVIECFDPEDNLHLGYL